MAVQRGLGFRDFLHPFAVLALPVFGVLGRGQGSEIKCAMGTCRQHTANEYIVKFTKPRFASIEASRQLR